VEQRRRNKSSVLWVGLFAIGGPVTNALMALLLASRGLLGPFVLLASLSLLSGLVGRSGAEKVALKLAADDQLSSAGLKKLKLATAFRTIAFAGAVATGYGSSGVTELGFPTLSWFVAFSVADAERELTSEAIRGSNRLVAASFSSRGARSVVQLSLVLGCLSFGRVPTLLDLMIISTVSAALPWLLALRVLIPQAERTGATPPGRERRHFLGDPQLLAPQLLTLALSSLPVWWGSAILGPVDLDRVALASRLALLAELPLQAFVNYWSPALARADVVAAIKSSRRHHLAVFASSAAVVVMSAAVSGRMIPGSSTLVLIAGAGGLMSSLAGPTGAILIYHGKEHALSRTLLFSMVGLVVAYGTTWTATSSTALTLIVQATLFYILAQIILSKQVQLAFGITPLSILFQRQHVL